MIVAGESFFDFTLSDTEGVNRFTAEARSGGLLLIAFFKVNCPVCQMAFPYLQTVSETYQHGLTVWGVSQNEVEPTREYARQYGCDFPMLLDMDLSITDRYDLETVPAMYLTDSGGRVLEYRAGWDREWMNRLSQTIADRCDAPFLPAVADGDPVMAFRPG